jgi:sec-independent protein translocase protein TatA
MFEGLFQPMHLLVIFFIALLVFGPKKLPELGKGIGEGIRALKEGMNSHQNASVEPEKPKPVESATEAKSSTEVKS